jgi:hypothetical protein
MILMALRHNVPDIQADEYWHDMGAGDGKLPFDVFFDWWTSDVGLVLVVMLTAWILQQYCIFHCR